MTEERRLYLKHWRAEKALSQADLAQLAGVDRVTINQLEVGRHRPRPSTIRKLASALQLEPQDLFRDPFSDLGRR